LEEGMKSFMVKGTGVVFPTGSVGDKAVPSG